MEASGNLLSASFSRASLRAATAAALPLESWLERLARRKTWTVNASGARPSSSARRSSTGTSTAAPSRTEGRARSPREAWRSALRFCLFFGFVFYCFFFICESERERERENENRFPTLGKRRKNKNKMKHLKNSHALREHVAVSVKVGERGLDLVDLSFLVFLVG